MQCLLRKWIVIHGFKSSYGKGSYYDKLFLGFNRVQDCLRVLEENQLVINVKVISMTNGIKISNTSLLQNYNTNLGWHTLLLNKKLNLLMYSISMIKENYLLSDEVKDLTIINDFMKGHTWASKGPITLRYKELLWKVEDFIHLFQTLPIKKIPIRINTLINGNPIVEVDYKANHLRMAIASRK